MNTLKTYYTKEIKDLTYDLTILYNHARHGGYYDTESCMKTFNSISKLAGEYGLEIFLMKYEKSMIRLLKQTSNGLNFKEFIKKYFELVIRNYKSEYMNRARFNKELRSLKTEFVVY